MIGNWTTAILIILFSLLPLLTYFLKEIKLPRRNLLVEFTCDSCGERTRRLINRVAYEKGTIFLQVCTTTMLIHLAWEKCIYIFLLQGYECFLKVISVGNAIYLVSIGILQFLSNLTLSGTSLINLSPPLYKRLVNIIKRIYLLWYSIG